ncbi:MAG: sensor histidine kinase [Blastocatellia bacterium]
MNHRSIVNEIDEHISPQITNRFIRISRSDGSVLYQPKPPRDGSFDPSVVSPAPVTGEPRFREEHPARKELLIYSLIDNAIKYTSSGGSINARTLRQNGEAVIEVADTGQGIPAEAVPYIFNRFYRADKARSSETGGSGLGLAIAKSICDLHGAESSLTAPQALEPASG